MIVGIEGPTLLPRRYDSRRSADAEGARPSRVRRRGRGQTLVVFFLFVFGRNRRGRFFFVAATDRHPAAKPTPRSDQRRRTRKRVSFSDSGSLPPMVLREVRIHRAQRTACAGGSSPALSRSGCGGGAEPPGCSRRAELMEPTAFRPATSSSTGVVGACTHTIDGPRVPRDEPEGQRETNGAIGESASRATRGRLAQGLPRTGKICIRGARVQGVTVFLPLRRRN